MRFLCYYAAFFRCRYRRVECLQCHKHAAAAACFFRHAAAGADTLPLLAFA